MASGDSFIEDEVREHRDRRWQILRAHREAEPVRAAKLPFALNPVNLEFFWRFAPGLAEYGIDTLSRSRPREPALFFETN
jgi:hypothetical protein